MKFSMKFMNRFFKDERGVSSVMMGVSTGALLMTAGVAIDLGRVNMIHENLQIAADSAALAAAATKGDDTLRKAAGERQLEKYQSFNKWAQFTPEFEIVANSAKVTLNTKVQGTFTSLLSRNDGNTSSEVEFPVIAKAVNSNTPGYGICVFATEEHATKAIYLYGTGDFSALGCHLYTNSDAAGAITIQGNKDVESDGMHAIGSFTKIGGAGSVAGAFAPLSSVLADPFSFELDDTSFGTNFSTNSSATLNAKTYHNISIKKGSATFSPGVHFVTGRLQVQAQGKLFGDGVTIVLVGKDAYLDVQAGGVIDIKAPRADQLSEDEKQYAGFAIVGVTNEAGEEANNANIIIGGAGSNIKGIVYTPDQDLKVTGNSGFNIDSKYSPLIAKTIEIGGNGAVSIQLDFAAYGFDRPDPLFVSELTEVRLVE